jgi:integrase
MATIKVKHLFEKDGRLYYSRRIPDDMKPHYSQSIIRTNLKTNDLTKATQLCAEYAKHDDGTWASIRSGVDPALTTIGDPGAAGSVSAILRLMQSKPKPVLLSAVLERYLSEHKRGQDPRFARDARRAVEAVIRVAGDKPLQDYSRDNARAVRDALIPGHVTATTRRMLDSANAVINFGRREFEVECSNPFERLAIAGEGLDGKKRLPFTVKEITTIGAACRQMDDSIRWIVAIQLGTGSRLAEIVGLRREDMFLDHEIPHIFIRPHAALGRSLKTPGSERLVPLLGLALWAGRQALAAQDAGGWLFPRYASDGNIRATHCSNTVNKWIRSLGIPKSTHSFRHSMKDLLRDAGVARDMAEALLGHGSRSIADSYGSGFTIQRKSEALQLVAIQI